jgi:NAD(P)-dependent dehydrogenase (short-subunit alcohol dehydrogenase family)
VNNYKRGYRQMKKNDEGAVLITGASTGIGKACALLLDRSGYRVFAGVRKVQAGESLRAEASERLTPVILDITDSEEIAQTVETVAKSLGPDVGLAGLVNNAGVAVVGPLEFLPLGDLRRQFEVNVIGNIAVTQAFIPLVEKGKGRIINISSPAAFFALPFLGGYCSSKLALEAVTTTLRRELLLRHIPVSIVAPGFTETPVWDKGYNQMDQLMDELPANSKGLYSKAYNAGRTLFER